MGKIIHNLSNKSGSKSLHEIADVGVVQMNSINRTEANLAQANSGAREYLKAWENNEANSEVSRWKLEAETSLDAAQRRIDEFNSIISPTGSQRETLALEANQIYQAYTLQLDKVLQATTLSAANEAWLPIMSLRRDFQTAVRNFIELTEERTAEILVNDKENSQLTLLVTFLIIGLALAMTALARLVIVRAIVNPINSTVEHLTAIAKGDLTQRIQQLGRNEIGVLLQGLQAMQLQLTDIVQMLKLNSDNLFTGTIEISLGTQDLSSRTEEQASAL